MGFEAVLFWACSFIVFYTYLGYGLFVWAFLFLRNLGKKHVVNPAEAIDYPELTLVVPAFNEALFIRKKIENTLVLDYPADKLSILFITDGSTDDTPDIIKQYPRLELLHSDQRRGKVAALNRAMKAVKTPYVVLCDANTILNGAGLKRMVRHYKNEKVGGVAGEKKVMNEAENNAAGRGEGLYWKYESMLKKLDARFYSVVGAAGELFSFRTDLFEPIEEDVLLDDFVLSMRICLKGYRIVYEPGAFAMESPSANIGEEQKRKVRISAGGFQSVMRMKCLLNVFKYPRLSFLYISHRLLRWMVCPFLLPLIWGLNLLILLKNPSALYLSIFILQLCFYLFAVIGKILSSFNKRSGLFNFPYYFVFMNLSLYMGLARYLKGNQSVIWEKAKRMD